MKFTKSPVAWFVLLLVAMPVVSIAVLTAVGSFRTKELPVLGKVPEFSLRERSGLTLDASHLKGHVWIAGFVYTGCPTECPLIVEKMQRLQKKFRFKDRWRLVAITSDPEHDTVQKLRDFAVKADADPYKWFFVTGDKKEIATLTEKGFKLAVDIRNPETHSTKLVLVDHLGQIRGYYDALDDKSVAQLMKDTSQLLKKAYGPVAPHIAKTISMGTQWVN